MYALKELRKKSSPGPDGITNEMKKLSPKTLNMPLNMGKPNIPREIERGHHNTNPETKQE